MTDFRNNHYVPRWYQERFIPRDRAERKYHYLDLRPEIVRSGSRTYKRNELLRWGPGRCFVARDLYTTVFGPWGSTGIEKHFFGKVDREGAAALDYFAAFEHPSVDGEALQSMLMYMSLQKLRTPKGLAQLAEMAKLRDRNEILFAMQQLRQVYCATWAESIWSIADASASEIKFIISDHPVTVYNRGCLPGSKWCAGHRDPDIRFTGTHTLFPISLDKVLILTNVSWIRNPYTKPTEFRPNPGYFRNTMFNFMAIQTGRALSSTEVAEINFVIKSRATRYVAAAEKDWLYPERVIPSTRWEKLGGGYLLMPDPRSVPFSSGMVLGFADGRREALDEYGRVPGQPGFRAGPQDTGEWETHLAFKGEYARVFGPRRRGLNFELGGKSTEEDSPDFHAFHLGLESKYKAIIRRVGLAKEPRRKRRGR